MTLAEHAVWRFLRMKQVEGFRFRRQVPLGRYIVDFACMSERLIVEIDGGQHADDKERDELRTAWLSSQGFRVLRFWDNQALGSVETVVAVIERALREGASPAPALPPGTVEAGRASRVPPAHGARTGGES